MYCISFPYSGFSLHEKTSLFILVSTMRRPFNLGYTGSSFEPHRNRSGIVGLAQPFFFSVGREEDGWLGHKVGGWKAIFKSRIEYLLLGLSFIQNISNQFWMNDHQVSISFVIYWRYMKCCRRQCNWISVRESMRWTYLFDAKMSKANQSCFPWINIRREDIDLSWRAWPEPMYLRVGYVFQSGFSAGMI